MPNLDLDAKRKARQEARAKSGEKPNSVTINGKQYQLRHSVPIVFAEHLSSGEVTEALASVVVPGKGESAEELAREMVRDGLLDQDDVMEILSEVYGMDAGNSLA